MSKNATKRSPSKKFAAYPRLNPLGVGRNISAADLVDQCFLAYNGGRLREAGRLLTDKMLPEDGFIGMSLTGALTPAGLGKSCTLLKSTSYMMHSDGFKIIRQMVLDDSALIIQDDSGVPWKYFTPEQWQVQLYGDYVSPFGKDFQFRTQKDLRAAYEAQRKDVRPLSFRMGYGAGKIESNLQVARRK